MMKFAERLVPLQQKQPLPLIFVLLVMQTPQVHHNGTKLFRLGPLPGIASDSSI